MQMRKGYIYLFIVCCITVLWFTAAPGCRRSGAPMTIVVQPLDDFPAAVAKEVFQLIKAIDSNTILRHSCPIPASAWYAPRARYRADTIIGQLQRQTGPDTVVIALTAKDISATKNNMADWGIMGLGYCPGRACVVSSFRLNKGRLGAQLFKLAFHELGHTQGLPHCASKTCFMRDAEGGNPLDAETGFCDNCKAALRRKGWRL